MEEHETHNPPRRLKAPPPRTRPGILAELGDRSLRRSSGSCLPLFAPPSLAGAAGEVVDSSSLRFLAAAALKRKEEEEEGRRSAEVSEQAHRTLALVREVVNRKRKRKKKRRKRLPRASSFARARCPWKSGHFSTSLSGTSCSVSASCLRCTARCLVRQRIHVHASVREVSGIIPGFLRQGGPRILGSFLTFGTESGTDF